VISRIRFDQLRREIPSSEIRYWTVADYKDILFTKAATEVGNVLNTACAGDYVCLTELPFHRRYLDNTDLLFVATQ
jgi:hypothetical protein